MDWRDWEALRLLKPTWVATKETLAWPDLARWLKLATIFFLAYGLLGGGGGGGNGGNLGLGGGDTAPGGVSSAGASMLMVAIAAFVGLAIFVYLGLLLVSSITKFTVLDMFVAPDVTITDSISENRPKGIKVFFFELLLVFVLLATIALAIAPFVLAGIAGAGAGGGILIIAVIAGILAFVTVLLITAIGFWVVRLVLDDLAIPLMHVHDTGLWGSLKEGLRLLRNAGKQGLVYLGVRLLLSIAAGIVRMIAGVVTFFFVAVVAAGLAAVTVLPAALAYGVGMASFGDLVPKNPSSLLIAAAVVTGIVVFFGVSLVVRYVATILSLPAYVYVRLYSLGFLAGRDTAVARVFPVLAQIKGDEMKDNSKTVEKGTASKEAMQTQKEKKTATSSAKKKAATKKKTAKRPSKKTAKKSATSKKKGSKVDKQEK